MRKIKYILFCALSVTLLLFVLVGCGLFKPSSTEDGTPSTGGGIDLSTCRIECSPNTVAYDGTEKKVKFSVYSAADKFLDSFDPEKTHDFLSATYADNINAGTATVTVAPKQGSSKYTGQVSGTFTVKPSRATVGDEQTLRAYLSCGNYERLTLAANITVLDALTVPQAVELKLGDFRLICRNNLDIQGELRTSEYDSLQVDGDLTVDGTLMLKGEMFVGGAVCNNGSIKSLDNNTYALYINGVANGAGVYENVNRYCRRPLSQCTVIVDAAQTEYTGNALRPPVTVLLDGAPVDAQEYSVRYSDNVQVGTATVEIAAQKTSTVLYGTVTKTFAVRPAAVTVHNASELQRALQNPNCDRVHIAATCNALSAFTIGQGYTVYIDDGDRTCVIYGVSGAGNLVVGNTTVCIDGKLNLTGNIENNGTVFVSSDPTATAHIENNGTLYINAAYAQSFSVTGNRPVARTPLPDDKVRQDKTESVYTGNDNYATVSIADENEPAPSTLYKYTATGKATSPKDAGDMTVTVTANRLSTRYYGSVEHSYRIHPAAITVTDSAQLLEKCTPNASTGTICNYSPITANFDAVLPANAVFKGRCEIVIPAGKTMTCADGLTIQSGAKLTVNGSFAQGGDLTAYGNIVNNGKAYFNGNTPASLTGSGTVYIRENITNAQEVHFTDTVTYDGTESALRPAVQLDLNGNPLTADNFTVSYENNTAVTPIGFDPANAVATAKPFSQYVYGVKKIVFSISAGECSVATFDELQAKTSDVRSGTTVCNWKKITVTADIRKACSYGYYPTITVHPNTTVQLGDYTIGGEGTYSKNFKLINNGTIEITSGVGIIDSVTYSGTGVCIGYAKSATALQNLSKQCNIVKLAADITETTSDVTFPLGKAQEGDLTLDLNGHTLHVRSLALNLKDCSMFIQGGTITATIIWVSNTSDSHKLTFRSSTSVTGDVNSVFKFANEQDKHNVLGVTFA